MISCEAVFCHRRIRGFVFIIGGLVFAHPFLKLPARLANVQCVALPATKSVYTRFLLHRDPILDCGKQKESNLVVKCLQLSSKQVRGLAKIWEAAGRLVEYRLQASPQQGGGGGVSV